MSVYLSPVGLSAALIANQLSVLVTFKERLCQAICANSGNKPSATVTYTAGQPTLQGSTVFVPITAAVQILSPNPKCCKATPQMFTENFVVAFQGRTTLPTSEPVIASLGTEQGVSCIDKYGLAHGYNINDSITVTIGASSTAS